MVATLSDVSALPVIAPTKVFAYTLSHLFDVPPKSNVPFVDGNKSLSTLPVKVTVSVVALPKSTFPLADNNPAMVSAFVEGLYVIPESVYTFSYAAGELFESTNVR